MHLLSSIAARCRWSFCSVQYFPRFIFYLGASATLMQLTQFLNQLTQSCHISTPTKCFIFMQIESHLAYVCNGKKYQDLYYKMAPHGVNKLSNTAKKTCSITGGSRKVRIWWILYQLVNRSAIFYYSIVHLHPIRSRQAWQLAKELVEAASFCRKATNLINLHCTIVTFDLQDCNHFFKAQEQSFPLFSIFAFYPR